MLDLASDLIYIWHRAYKNADALQWNVEILNLTWQLYWIHSPFQAEIFFLQIFSFSTSLYCKNGADLSFHEKKGFKMHSLGDKMVKSVQIVYLESLLLTLNMFLTFSWYFYCWLRTGKCLLFSLSFLSLHSQLPIKLSSALTNW